MLASKKYGENKPPNFMSPQTPAAVPFTSPGSAFPGGSGNRAPIAKPVESKLVGQWKRPLNVDICETDKPAGGHRTRRRDGRRERGCARYALTEFS